MFSQTLARTAPARWMLVTATALTFAGLASAQSEPGAQRRASAWPPAPALVIQPDSDAGPLPPSVTAERTEAGRWRCQFRFKPDGNPERVTVAGTFNEWNPQTMPLARAADGTWLATVDLPPGVHEYKFVLDGETWIADPLNPDGTSDGRGGRNSVLRLGRVAQMKMSGARSDDGRIEGLAIEHDPKRPLHFQPLDGGLAIVRLRTLAGDVERVAVAVRDGDEAPMSIVAEQPPFVLWEAQAALLDGHAHAEYDESVPPAAGPAYRVREYTFVLTDGDQRFALPQTFGGTLLLKKDVFHTPDWAKHAIWYQIFPDRFRNGDPSNDRKPVRPWTSEWFTPSDWEGQDGQTFYKHFVFDRQYGGDIAGLMQMLPYLKQLGVNALYLNPMFKSESNHKYNGESYIHIDDHFGTLGDYDAVAAVEDLNDPATWQWTESDKLFLAFIKAAHEQGLRVIIDGVFNHVGTRHPAFQDVKKNGQKSKYADWFNVTSWEPFKYEGWFGLDALPVFRKDKNGLASEQVKKHIFAATRRWLDPDGDGDPSDGIDGWRLDVPNEIPAPFWVEWREVVKSVNPDAYITGEIWDRADAWLDGRHFDAVMNYEFARPTVSWIFDRKTKGSPSDIDRRLRDLRLAYPLEATLVMQNLMDSHDTDRMASQAHNPDRPYDDGNRLQDNGPNYDNSRPSPLAYQKARLAALLQMTYVGAPMIYYGDEVGMWGADDPTCRKPMLWEDLQPYEKPAENFVMKEHLEYYRRLVALRNAHPALRTGTIQTLLTDDEADVWAFLRKNDDEQLVVVLNASNHEREVTVPLPPTAPNRWLVAFTADAEGKVRGGVRREPEVVKAEGHKLTVTVGPITGIVLHSPTPK